MATELETWEESLRNIFYELDHILEDRYGSTFPLNPVRAGHGATNNPEDSGLFDVGAAFSAGFGSRHGEGYVIETRWATLKPVPEETRKEAESIVEAYLNRRLPEVFPGKNLQVVRDGTLLKIIGDLSLK
ncbi:MAG TPA: hypothetical protein DET40_13780 [Lentisphaeria bacterium]|nr:MAG: hypothetical protein A2X45_01790 [Lentisphaerae bacterium GWF2_50_93]HCE44611.1 hypothetical protein [Lentisphaeria bacterium]